MTRMYELGLAVVPLLLDPAEGKLLQGHLQGVQHWNLHCYGFKRGSQLKVTRSLVCVAAVRHSAQPPSRALDSI